jgi:predicted nucleic-acid-binding Zn-ribbon protein
MIQCAKCGNDTRTSALVTEQGDVMVTGPFGTEPQPVLAQTCTACGYIELYAPQMVSRPEQQVAVEAASVEAATTSAVTA